MKKTLFAFTLGLATFVGANSASAYTVKSGDTLSKIANNHGTDLRSVIELNPQIGNPNLIFPNQNVVLPNEKSVVKQSTTIKAAAPTTIGRISVSQSERDLLARLVEAEASGESFAGKEAVATVVLNRVLSDLFPNTIRSVIYQSGQFSPVSNGSIYNAPSNDSQNAVGQAIQRVNSGQSQGALYFYNYHVVNSAMSSKPTVAIIGNHIFKR